ncbi:MAG TPA: carbohydrate-binding protein [Ktedonobacterales bacterium]|nr:carbohydrate-binding protein [Ktedonobacterales bacterium]
MNTRQTEAETITQRLGQPVRRLSILRVACALVLFLGVMTGCTYAIAQRLTTPAIALNPTPWFAAYVDVTASPRFEFEQRGAMPERNMILSFVVSSPANACTPAWGAAYTLDQAATSLDLDRRIVLLQQQGGHVTVSFGGRDNHELAVGCTDPVQLKDAYKSVIDRYRLDTIDLDLESSNLTDSAAAARRAIALADLQAEERAADRKLAIWLTLPVTPQGLTKDGTDSIALMLAKGVDLAGVNIMTLDFGASLTAGQTMLSGAESALTATHRQLGILYDQAGVHLNSASLWAKLGATPMIGQNDVAGEVFTLDDAQALHQFVLSQGVGRVSMWSANRDVACGSNYVYLNVVSNSCSGVAQNTQQFASTLGNGFTGTLADNAGLITAADAKSAYLQAPDDPATSPYPIWTASGAYPAGSEVVWHHMVYKAKWWTQGDVPDDPVLESWQTPWSLIGPVLPGEKPIPQPTLPVGAYPNWSGTATYDAGQRVLLNGVPYQAKWWNQGQSPAAAASNPDGSPWVPLTPDQIDAILAQTQK